VGGSTQRVPGRALGHEGALGPSLTAVGAHKVLVAAVTLVTLLAALAWLGVRTPQYVASSELLVTPLSQQDETFRGLQVLRETGDPTRTMQTAAALIESRGAAQATARILGDGWTAGRVLDAIEVEPKGESNILAVTATTDSADEASRMANAFADATLQQRNRALAAQISEEVSRLRSRPQALRDPTGTAVSELASRIDQLESVLARGDPTLSLSERATSPPAPIGARARLVVIIALLAGLALGAAAAVLLDLFDPRVRDEGVLVAVYALPVLARVPLLSRRARRRIARHGWHMPPIVHEAFRTVLAQLDVSPQQGYSVMVTSASTGDGKTTSAINLALSMGAAGHSVILLDLDLRKPDVARSLGIQMPHPVSTLLKPKLTGSRFTHLLHTTPLSPNVRVLCVERGAGNAADLAALQDAAIRLLAEARQHADFVVADTPPLGEVADALRFADAVDGTILVAWPRKTQLRNLEFARDLLERADQTPIGYVLIGAQQGAAPRYYEPYGSPAATVDSWGDDSPPVRGSAGAPWHGARHDVPD
jgi:Mrp family chromosome partitioning ATPase